MVYHPKITKYVGKPARRGVNLAQEADLVMNNVLKSSGFFRGPLTGPNSGYGTTNQSMENFIGKWNNMNSKRKGRFNKYAGTYRKDLNKAAY